MTSTETTEQDSSAGSKSLILKTDTRGRVCTPVERRQALLAEFDRSGLSGKQFARLSGVKYSTFQYWIQCRKGRSDASKPAAGQQSAWLETVLQQGAASASPGLLLHLPGGVRAEITNLQQVGLAAALVCALEKPC